MRKQGHLLGKDQCGLLGIEAGAGKRGCSRCTAVGLRLRLRDLEELRKR